MAYLLALVGHECQQLKRAIFAFQGVEPYRREEISMVKGAGPGWAKMPRAKVRVVGAVGIEPTTPPV